MKRTLIRVALVGLLGTSGLLVACGDGSNGGGNGSDVTGPGHGDYHNYAVNQVLLPQSKTDYSIDLNGDGKVDNQMGVALGLLSGFNFNAQEGVNSSIASGSIVILMSVQTQDATLQSDTPVGVTLYIGQPFESTVSNGACTANCPDFSGMGVFTVDASARPDAGWPEFWGALSGGKFSSNNPVTTKNPVTATLKLALVAGAPPLSVKLNGAHLSFTTGTDAASGKPGLLDGRLQGSIENSDLQNVLLPQLAEVLTTSGSTDILAIIDVGNCTNPDGSSAAKDGKIDTCELAAVAAAALYPDIQVFDASHNYAPNKDNTTPDSLSFGVGFTAVQAVFDRP